MVVIFLLISSLMIVTGIKSTLIARKWKQKYLQLDGPDPDIKVLQYFGIGTVAFFASMFFAICVTSPKWLHATDALTLNVSSVLVLIGMAGFLACYIIGSPSLILMLWVGQMLLWKKIARRKAP